MRSRRFRIRSAALTLLWALAPTLVGAAERSGEPRRLEFLGEAVLPADLVFDGTPVGGLSALTWDAEKNLYYALSDDPSARAAARFYSVRIDLGDGRLDPGDAAVVGVTRLRDLDGKEFERLSLDPEGLTLAADRSLFLSSEGQIREGVPSFLAELAPNGQVRRFLPLDHKFLPPDKGFWRALRRGPRRRSASGTRHNQGLESLTLSPDGRWLFSAIENALLQDGPAASLDARSPVRILRYETATGKAIAEYAYWAETVAQPADPAGGDVFEVAGLVELLATGENTLLALERSYSSGVGNTIRLYRVDVENASDVSSLRSLSGQANLRAAKKTLLLDLAELGVVLDNVEGMTFGPPLADGRRTLVLVSDDNFNSSHQKSQFLAFAWSDEPATPGVIQGTGHRSPLEHNWVFAVPAIVTAVDSREDGTGTVWAQDGGAEGAGFHVSTHDVSGLAPGDRVEVYGRVEESGREGALTTTGLIGGRFETVARGGDLPPPVRLGRGGLSIPAERVDDPGMQHFDPRADAMDFFESLEGRYVEIPDALVVGAGNRFGDCVVLADGGLGSGPRTAAGGLRLAPFDPNPERLVISSRLLEEPCRADVGDRFSRPLRGVLHYDFGVYRLLLTETLPDAEKGAAKGEPTTLRGDAEHLTVATFNVENLDPDDAKMDDVARVIAGSLAAPDVVALQEVQDASGREDDGTVSGGPTFEALIEAVVAAGGPRYEFRQIDPADKADGGQPGGNIRVGFLLNPRRVEVPDRQPRRPRKGIEVSSDDRGPFLSPNPARAAANDPAFLADEARGYEATRKPLALEIEFNDRRVFLVNAHLKSKSGDDGLFGPRQPPLLVTEEQRSLQAARLRELADEILKFDPQAAVIVLGDLNEHEFRGPLDVLTAGNLTNLVERIPGPERYTYNYLGNSQVLDHILVSPSLAAGAAVEILHLHADRAVPRASDHDPILARLPIVSASSARAQTE